MCKKELDRIAENARLIVSGYAFTESDTDRISILNLNHPESAMIINRSGEIIETNMDQIEQKIVLDLCKKNLQFMEV